MPLGSSSRPLASSCLLRGESTRRAFRRCPPVEFARVLMTRSFKPLHRPEALAMLLSPEGADKATEPTEGEDVFNSVLTSPTNLEALSREGESWLKRRLFWSTSWATK